MSGSRNTVILIGVTVPDLAAFADRYPKPTGKLQQPDWAATEDQLGIHLPADYKFIVDNYGLGVFDSTIAVYVPVDHVNDGLYGLLVQRDEQLGYLVNVYSEFHTLVSDGVDAEDEVWIDETGTHHPVGLGTEPPRYLPWGVATTGEFGYWLVTGSDPDEWPALLTDLGGRWIRGNGGLTQLIVDTQDRKYPAPVVDPFDGAPTFGPVP